MKVGLFDWGFYKTTVISSSIILENIFDLWVILQVKITRTFSRGKFAHG